MKKFANMFSYKNIAKRMDKQSAFISNSSSIFPHQELFHIDLSTCKNANIIDDDKIEEYLSKLPNSFDEWLNNK